jgi:hypothetical protein
VANEFDYALVVGINDYANFDPLAGAVNDARNFVSWLESPSGGDLLPESIELIVSDGTYGEPRRDQVENTILPLIDRYRTSGLIGRRMYLFLAGHGIDVGDLEDCGLVMADATSIATDRTVPGRRLATAFKHSHAFNEVVLFMDCCRELVMQNPSGDLPILASLGRVQDSPARMLHGLATQWQRTAGERDLPDDTGTTSPQGIFTYALLDGLRRAGDENGEVTASGLKGYVKEFMLQLTGREQDPDIDVAPSDIVICSPGEGSTSVVVKLAPGTVDFDVRDGTNLTSPIDLSSAENLGNGTWRVSLRPGSYLFGAPAGETPGGYITEKTHKIVGGEYFVEL